MTTTFDLHKLLQTDDSFVSDSDLLGYSRPRDVVQDPLLTLSRKRQLLAYWASDIHAVPGAPALRSFAYGPTVSIDEIMEGLRDLDDMVDLPAIPIGGATGASA